MRAREMRTNKVMVTVVRANEVMAYVVRESEVMATNR